MSAGRKFREALAQEKPLQIAGAFLTVGAIAWLGMAKK
jgi:hypothetical protein